MSKTVEHILLEKYLEFKLEISATIADFDKYFQELDPTDLIDLMDLMLFMFPDDNTKENLETLLKWKGVDLAEDDMQQLAPVVNKYLVFLRKVKKAIEE
jgi:hypothetical protein